NLLFATCEGTQAPTAWQQDWGIEENRDVLTAAAGQQHGRLDREAVRLNTGAVVVELEGGADTESFIGVEVERRHAGDVPTFGNPRHSGARGPIVALLSPERGGGS